jgi:hypothetical protein
MGMMPPRPPSRPVPRPMLRAELPALENLLLWCMRAWVIGHCRGVETSARIEQALEQIELPEALGYLDGFMWALSQGARRTIQIDCVCHPEVSADERALLAVFALQQQEEHEDAYAILARMMTERAAIAACDSAQRLALMLSGVGEELCAPPERADRLSLAGPSCTLH